MSSKLLRWSGYVGIAVLFAIVCVLLAQWQFDRNEQRAAVIALVDANYDQAPVELATLLPGGNALDPHVEWRQARLQGHYAVEHELLVRNRPHGGTRAFEVVVPFHTTDGAVLIVNRGWVLPGEGDVPDFVPQPVTGELSIVVRLRPGENLPSSGRGAPEGQVPTIHLPTIADTTGSGTIVAAYGQLVSETPAAANTPYGFDKPTEDPGPHLSYAIQWILFAIMGFVFIYYVIRTERIRAREEKAGRVYREPHQKRDRDSAEEDALLDG